MPHMLPKPGSGPGRPARAPGGDGACRTGGAAAGPDPAYWVEKMQAIATERDESAFVEVFRHFAPRVKAYLVRSGTEPAQAEEIVQDALSAVWHKSRLFDPSRASVATWIFTIARNRRIDTIRRTRRPEPEDLPWGPEPDPEPAEVIGLQQDSARVEAALAELPAKQRVLIERAYFGELTHSEIAAETGLPLGTIKSRIRLALERLRHAMAQDGSGGR